MTDQPDITLLPERPKFLETPVPSAKIYDAKIAEYKTSQEDLQNHAVQGIRLHGESEESADPIYANIPREHIMSWAHDIPQLAYNHAYTLLPALEHLKALADYQEGHALTVEQINAICSLITLPDDSLAERFFAPQLDAAYGEEIYLNMQYEDAEAPYEATRDELLIETEIMTSGLKAVPSASLLFAYNAMGDYLNHFLPMNGIYKKNAIIKAKEVKAEGDNQRALSIYNPEDHIGFDSMKPSFGEGYDMFCKVLTRANNLFQHPEAGSRKVAEGLNAENIEENLRNMGIGDPEAALKTFATFFGNAARNMGIEPNMDQDQLVGVLDDQLRSQIYNAVNLTVHFLQDEYLETLEGFRVSFDDIYFCKWWADQRKQAREANPSLFSFEAEDALEKVIDEKYSHWIDSRHIEPFDHINKEPGDTIRIATNNFKKDVGRLVFGWNDGMPDRIVDFTVSPFKGQPYPHAKKIPIGITPSTGYSPRWTRNRANDVGLNRDGNGLSIPGNLVAYQDYLRTGIDEYCIINYGFSGGIPFQGDSVKTVKEDALRAKFDEYNEIVSETGVLGLFKCYTPHAAVESSYVNNSEGGHKKRYQSYRDDFMERFEEVTIKWEEDQRRKKEKELQDIHDEGRGF